jgi:hypothetical protein
LLLCAILPVTARAQLREVSDSTALPPVRGAAGGSLQLALPQGEFAEFVDAGFGLGGFFAVQLGRGERAALRFDGSFLQYGHVRVRRPLSPTVPQVTVDVTTSNNIYSFFAGPEVNLATGAVRPYVRGQIGLSYFATTSSVKGTSNSQDFASSTNFDDFTFLWLAGAGLRIRLAGGRTPVYLDLAGDYMHNGRVQYLREGSIRDNGNGTITITPIESQTNLFLLRAGASVGLRW